ncbi:MAG: hypothetical protein WKF30_03970 [Pyrinomonadaceae bacterium]
MLELEEAPFMSIANELCSEVVNAVLTRQENKGMIDPQEMTQIFLAVHQTLRRLHADERRRPSETHVRAISNAPSSLNFH